MCVLSRKLPLSVSAIEFQQPDGCFFNRIDDSLCYFLLFAAFIATRGQQSEKVVWNNTHTWHESLCKTVSLHVTPSLSTSCGHSFTVILRRDCSACQCPWRNIAFTRRCCYCWYYCCCYSNYCCSLPLFITPNVVIASRTHTNTYK